MRTALTAACIMLSSAIVIAQTVEHRSGSESSLVDCPVTQPNGQAPPGERSGQNHHGNGKLWTVLWPDGLIEFGEGRPGRIGADGALGMKFPWWRGEGVRGRLEISGRRLDGDAAPAYGEVPDGYGDTGFQAAGVVFPTEGCWEITGSVGDAELTFVQFVRLIR